MIYWICRNFSALRDKDASLSLIPCGTSDGIPSRATTLTQHYTKALQYSHAQMSLKTYLHFFQGRPCIIQLFIIQQGTWSKYDTILRLSCQPSAIRQVLLCKLSFGAIFITFKANASFVSIWCHRDTTVDATHARHAPTICFVHEDTMWTTKTAADHKGEH